MSVKSGADNKVPIPELAAAADAAVPYAYSTHGRYTATPSKHGVIAIKDEELIGFIAEHPELLPPRVSRWLMGSVPSL